MDLLELGAISRAFHADRHNFKVRLDPTLNDFTVHNGMTIIRPEAKVNSRSA